MKKTGAVLQIPCSSSAILMRMVNPYLQITQPYLYLLKTVYYTVTIVIMNSNCTQDKDSDASTELSVSSLRFRRALQIEE